MRVAGLVLAAGAGRRFGMPKALVRHQGRLLVERAVEVAVAAGCAPVVVVLGAAAADIRAVAELGGAVVVDNPDWETGMGSSLRAGLAALAATDADAAVVLLVDMPGVTAAAVRRVASLAGADALVMAGYGERRGHPVLFGHSHWSGIADAAVGDVGARPYLRRHVAEVQVVPCCDVADDGDIDAPADARDT